MSAAAKPGGALRDAGLSALVAFGLFGPMIGLKTDTSDAGLMLTWRPLAVAIAVAVVVPLVYSYVAYRRDLSGRPI